MNETDLMRAAELLAAAWRERVPIAGLPAALRPRTRQQAYTIQDYMAQRLGHEVAGWKVGAASPGQIKAEGLDGPLMGRILAPTLYHSPVELPGKYFTQCMLECEFAFRLQQELAPRKKAYQAEEIADNALLCLAIELTGTRYTPDYKPDLFSNMADNGNSGGLVTGAEIADWRSLNLREVFVDLRINAGAPVANLKDDWRVDPLQVLEWTVNCLSERGIGLAAGAIVSTGSATRPQAFSTGDSAVAVYQELGKLEVGLI